MPSYFSIGGLASGLDTNAIIDQLIAIDRQPLVKMEAKQDTLTWKKDFWAEIKAYMTNFKSAANNLLSSSYTAGKTITSSDSDVATATAKSSTAVGSYRLTEVAALATATRMVSGVAIGSSVDATKAVSNDDAKFGTAVTAGTFTIRNVQFILSDEDSDGDIDRLVGPTGTTTDAVGSGLTLEEIIDHLNSVSASTGVTASLAGDSLTLTNTVAYSGQQILVGSSGDTSSLLSALHLIGAEQDSGGDGSKTSTVHLGHARTGRALSAGNFGTAATGDANGDGSFKINGVTINHNIDNDTLSEVISRINNSAAGVNASYDSVADKLILTSKTAGSSSILREDVSGNFLAAAKLLAADSPVTTSGSNAKFKVEGFNGGNWIYSSSNSVSSLIEGVTINLKSTLNAVDGPVDIAVSHDAAKAKGAIQDFVNKYNDLMTVINNRLSEEKVKDPKTLADQKKGLLKGDRILILMKTEMARIASSTVSRLRPGSAAPDGEDDPLSESLDQLSEIGISITSANYGKSGLLVIDDEALSEALSEDPAALAKLFSHDSEAGSEYDGIARRIYDMMDSYTDSKTELVGAYSVKAGVIPRQEDVLSREIEYYQDRIDDMGTRLEMRRENLVKRFAAMEAALSQMQSMSNWLSSQISGLFG
ncbi:MAG: flagellar filament capping protein FliD [Actinomycetota bacterium]|nr:flagellar filament capping protein FliD [Actinomycetota bacterium]